MANYLKLFMTHEEYEEYKREHPTPTPEPPVIPPIPTPNHVIIYEANAKIISVASSYFIPSIVSHEFNDGVGYILCENDVTNIKNNAFYCCYGLRSIDIPSSVTSIGEYVFYRCSGLTSVTIKATTPPTLGTSTFDETNDCPIYVFNVDTYKSAAGWSKYADRIKPIDPSYAEKWVEDGTMCEGYNLYVKLKLEISHDSGQTWEDGGEYKTGELIEPLSSECGYDPTTASVITYKSSAKLTETTSEKTAGLKTNSFNTNIASHTFANGIGTIAFYETLTNVGDGAFYSAPITELVLPKTVTRIGKMAIYCSSTLSKLTIEATTPPTVDNYYIQQPTSSCNAIQMKSSGMIYVPSSSVNAYKSASTWTNYTNKITPIT